MRVNVNSLTKRKYLAAVQRFLQWHQSTKTLYIGTSGLVDRL